MDHEKLYNPEVLRNKVPTLHPRYQWMKLELEPDDRIVLTSISGHYTVAQIIDLTGLAEDSVARVILKLVGRGVVLWDDALPFYDEEALLEVLPTFDPQNINRNAHLDDTDRMLLTFINGRTSVRQMEAALPLSRERLLASVVRLRLADVIGVAQPPPSTAAAPPPVAASTYQVPEGSIPQRPAAPTPAAGVSARPAAPHLHGMSANAGTTSSSASASQRSVPPEDPGSGRVFQNRQEAFEEVTNRLLRGESIGAEYGDFPDPLASPPPRKGTSTVREHEAPRYERKTGKTADKKPRARTAEVKAKPGAREKAGTPSAVPKIAIAAIIVFVLVIGWLAMSRVGGGGVSVEEIKQIVPVSQLFPIQASRFTAQVSPAWFDLSRDAKRSSMTALVKLLQPRGVTAIVLSDEDNRPVAEWKDGILEFTD